MSDRRSVESPMYAVSSWACVISMILAGGCERAATTSQPQVQTAQAIGPARSRPKPAAPAPLLLEDEPAGGASNGSAADNSRCFVCHVNYMQEKLATTHAKVNIGCANCHGPSDAHIADESWASGGNGTAPDRMYTQGQNQRLLHGLSPEGQDRHAAAHGGPGRHGGQKVCTDCHGKPPPAPTPLQVEVARSS